MKQTFKTRLLAVLAFSSVTIGGQLMVNAQDGFGIVRPVKPQPAASNVEHAKNMPPIVSVQQSNLEPASEPALPPIVAKNATLLKPLALPQMDAAPKSDNTPLAFAPSKITQAGYDQSGEAKIQVGQVGFSEGAQTLRQSPQNENEFGGPELPPIVTSPSSSLPPIVSSASSNDLLPSIAGSPSSMNELPPILNSNAVSNPGESVLEPYASQPNSPLVGGQDALMPMDAQSIIDNDSDFNSEIPAVDTATADDLSSVQEAGYSTSNVPMFGSSTPLAMESAPPIVGDQGSGSRNQIGGFGAQQPGNAGSLPMVAPVDTYSPPQSIPQMNAPPRPQRTSIDPAYLPMPSITNSRSMAQPMGSSVAQPIQPMGQSLFSQPITDAPVIPMGTAGCASCSGVSGGCANCGSGPVSSCQSCGPGGCYDSSSVTGQFNNCGSCSMARRYLIAEALYFDRDDGNISNSNFGSLGNFDLNAGWRFTIGRRQDSTRGTEFSYMGTMDLDQTRNYSSPAGIITSRFIPTDGFGPAQTAAFFNATQQSETKETSFHSLEFNRVKWGWDVLKTFIGVRYLMVDDSYSMFSQNLGGDQGTFQMEMVNHMIGPQIGAELFYDVGNRLSFSFTSKLGVYANYNEADTQMTHNGTQFINSESSGGTLSSTYEAGLTGHYRLNRRARLRFGYNILFLGEVATVSDNFPRALAPSTGGNVTDSDNMFFHGLSFGLEVYR